VTGSLQPDATMAERERVRPSLAASNLKNHRLARRRQRARTIV
jgi:hypothetical protein